MFYEQELRYREADAPTGFNRLYFITPLSVDSLNSKFLTLNSWLKPVADLSALYELASPVLLFEQIQIVCFLNRSLRYREAGASTDFNRLFL